MRPERKRTDRLTRLRVLRLAVSMELSELHPHTGVYSAALSQIETRRKSAGAQAQSRLSQFYGVPVSYLFDTDGFAKLYELSELTALSDRKRANKA